MKKKFIILTTLLLVFILISVYFIYDSVAFNKKVKDDINTYARIAFVVVDYDKTKKSNFDDISTYENAIIKNYTLTEKAKKEGDYYVSEIKGMNPNLFKNISKITFSINNLLGEVINDAKYDKKTKKIYIPSKYFENEKYKEYKGVPIRLELVSRMREETLNKNTINVSINKFFKTEKVVKTKKFFDSPKISLYKYNKGRGISKDEFKVYINNSKTPLSIDAYDWDSKSGVLTIDDYPLYINNIDIKFKKISLIKNYFFHIFSFKNVEATKKSGVGSYVFTPSGGNIKGMNNTIEPLELEYWYDAASGYYHNGNYLSESAGSSQFDAIESSAITARQTLDNGDRKASYWDFYVKVNTITFEKKDVGTVTVTVNKWLRLACSHNGQTVNPSEKLSVKATLYIEEDGGIYVGLNSSGLTGGTVATQTANGGFRTIGTSYSLKIQKKHYDITTESMQSWEKGKIRFRLYSGFSDDGTDCNGDVIATTRTNSKGVATFEGLSESGIYCAKEINYDEDETSSISRDQWPKKFDEDEDFGRANYHRDGNCDGTTGDKIISAKTTDQLPMGTIVNDYCNIRIKYSFIIKKKDAEEEKFLPGATFTVTNAQPIKAGNDNYNIGQYTQTVTLGKDGDISVCGLPAKVDYTITETSAPDGYWLDSPTTMSIEASKLSAYDITKGCTATATKTKEDHKQYYCMKVKKVDKDTGQPLPEATFTATYGTTSFTATSDNNGIATFLVGANNVPFTVVETGAPSGYSVDPNPKTVSPTLINSIVDLQTATTPETGNPLCAADPTPYVYSNPALVMNWYKIDEDGNAVKTDTTKSAKFKVKTTGGYLKFGGKVPTTDANGTQKMCYQYDKTNAGTDTLDSDENGEVCVRGIPQGTYTVEEVQPAQYHTFGNSNEITLSTSTIFSPKTSSNVFINLPTTFKFKKYVAKVDGGDGDEKIVVNGVEKTLTELTTEELKKIDFQIFNSAGQVMDFYYDEATGKYNFGGNVIDPKVSQTGTNILHLNNDREIIVDHLPWGETFTIKEVQSKVCDPNASEEDCIGYYYPNYNEQGSTFTVTTCSNDGSGIDKCPSTNKVVILGLTNTPTEINFTKRDFYDYNDQADIADKDRDKDKVDSSVEFENAKERSDFDRITFKLKNKLSGKYLTLKFVKNHGNCKTDDSYAEYRYVLGDQSDPNGTEIHTCGGHIKITNLCRGNEYTVEEISVPEDSVYVKEKDENGNNPSVDYKVACTDGSFTPESTTHIINDKPTRVRFEKRDSKYNYLIPDETTTFKLYRCKKGEECHPGDYSTDKEREAAGMELVKFYDRGVITNDEEDPTDAEGLAGVEVYRRMSDSDAEAGAKVITDLHPYKGILVMRYLQANYNYVLLETVAPKNYQLPLGRNAETPFKPVNDTVDVDPVDVPNKPTSLLIKKYDSKGNLLPGAEFKIYEGTSCDKNLSAMNQPKKELKLKTIRDGIYENRETKDTDIVKTCKDREDEKCSDINPNGPVTNLTYSETVRNQALNNSYLGSFADFADDSTATKDGKKIEINEGTALIQYLEYGHCYIIEETKAPEGHSLPKKTEDRFTMVTIDENDAYAHSTYYKFINKPTPFQFYKYDEFNQLLDGAEFKLQKLDDNKKYQDVTVSLDEDLKKLEEINDDNSDALNNQINNLRTQAEEGVPFYRVDSETDNKTITTKNGTAVVYYLSQGQYRIIETKPAPGKELTKNPNIATFFVDDSGNVYGNSIIVNKAKTERIEVKNSASAELIVNIQTGQTVIRYGLIIAIIAALITGLMILKNKMK